MLEVSMEQKHQVIMASSSANCKYKNITPSKKAKKTHSNSYNTFHHIKSEETKNAYQQQLHKNLCKTESTYGKISARVSPMQQQKRFVSPKITKPPNVKPYYWIFIKPAEGTSFSY